MSYKIMSNETVKNLLFAAKFIVIKFLFSHISNQVEETDLVYFIYFLWNICSAPQGNKFCGAPIYHILLIITMKSLVS